MTFDDFIAVQPQELLSDSMDLGHNSSLINWAAASKDMRPILLMMQTFKGMAAGRQEDNKHQTEHVLFQMRNSLHEMCQSQGQQIHVQHPTHATARPIVGIRAMCLLLKLLQLLTTIRLKSEVLDNNVEMLKMATFCLAKSQLPHGSLLPSQSSAAYSLQQLQVLCAHCIQFAVTVSRQATSRKSSSTLPANEWAITLLAALTPPPDSSIFRAIAHQLLSSGEHLVAYGVVCAQAECCAWLCHHTSIDTEAAADGKAIAA